MKINSVDNNYNQNFKGVNLVRISKSAFEKPCNAAKASKIFFEKYMNTALFEASKKSKGDDFVYQKLAQKAGEVTMFLESPAYEVKKMISRSSGNCVRAKEPGYYSFYILTGREHQKAAPLFKMPHVLRKLAGAAVSGKKNGAKSITDALGKAANAEMEQKLLGAPVKEFSIEYLFDIDKIFNKMI